MKFRLRNSFLLCGLCAAAALVAALGEQHRLRPVDSPATDTLNIATTVEPETLHPVFGASSMATMEILGALFEPLTLYDDQHRLVPCLATEIPSLDNGGIRHLPDGRMETTWHLRPDARWSDGVPVSADDFIFTHQLIMHPDVPSIRELDERIDDMLARDDGRTLIVRWKKPYAFAHEGHRHLVVPRHIEEPVLRSLAGNEKEYEWTPFNHQPLGNGPYRLVEWVPGRHLILEPQPYWHGPTPMLSRLVYRFLPEGETILANLDTGRLGAVSPIALDYDLALEFDRRSRERGDAAYVGEYHPGLWWEHIDFNTENPVTADKRVRQALTAALNRRAMSEALFAGQDLVTDTWLPSLHPASFPPAGLVTPDLPRYPYDPQRAVALLESAGWEREAGGVRFKDGRPLRLTLRYTAGEPLTDRMAQMAQEDWRAIGVDLSLQPLDEKQFGDTSSDNRAFQGLALYAWVMDPSADGITFWTSANIPTDQNPTGQNACRWSNPRSDQLLSQATEELDEERRRLMLREQQRIWAEELPAIPLFFREEISVRHHRLAGWRPTGTDTPISWNCAEWRWLPR